MKYEKKKKKMIKFKCYRTEKQVKTLVINNATDTYWDKESHEYGEELFKLLGINGNVCRDLRILKLFKNRKTFFEAVKHAFFVRNLVKLKEELSSNWSLTHLYFVTLSLLKEHKKVGKAERVDLIIDKIKKWREDNIDKIQTRKK